MDGTYFRLGVHVHAHWRAVVRAATFRLDRRAPGDPALRAARKRFYRQMPACHARNQELVRRFRL